MDTTRHGIIFGAGEYFGIRPTPLPQALVVAADGGYDAARSFGFTPDAVIGDFDSLEGDIPDNGHTVRLHPEKDDTDMLSAFKIAWQQGARIFDVYGGLGGRLDHTIGNLQLLAEVSRHGGIAFLHGADTIVTAISKGTLSFPAGNVEARRMISVFSHSDTSYDVTEIGLKYELDRVQLRNDHPSASATNSGGIRPPRSASARERWSSPSPVKPRVPNGPAPSRPALLSDR